MKKFLCLIAISLLAACGGGGGGGSDNSGGSSTLETITLSGTTDSVGAIDFSFTIPEGASGFQIVAICNGQEIRILSATGPGGQSLFGTSIGTVNIERTDAISLQSSVNTFNFPSLTDGVAGGTYHASYLVTTGKGKKPSSGVTVDFFRILKSGSGTSSGVLPVNIAFVGPVANSTKIADAIEASVQVWQEIFARAGISLDVQYYNFNGPDKLPDPRKGSSFYQSVADAMRVNSVNIVLGRDVTSISRGNNIEFGIPGGTPGAAIPTVRSVGVLSIEEVTGGDALFDSDAPGARQLGDSEVRLAGEEMARLAGHILGLQDPVDFDGDRASLSDGLSDTESCVTLTQCENEKQPRANFMFPRTIKIQDKGNKFYPRDYISPQQRALMFRSVLVR